MQRLTLLGLTVVLAAACNASDLVNDPGAPSPHPSVTILPTATGTPTLPYVGDHDCGNADYMAWETYDPDDYPAPADNYLCYWMCASDPGYPFWPGDPAPPHEIIVEFDYDPPMTAYQESAAVYLPCYSAHP